MSDEKTEKGKKDQGPEEYDVEELRKEALYIPQKATEAKSKFIQLDREKQSLEQDYRGLQNQIQINILTAQTDEQKPKFPNDKMRQAEFHRQCSESKVLKVAGETLNEKVEKITKIKLEFEFYEMRFKAIRAVLASLQGAD